MRSVEHTISVCVCELIWQPFFPQDSLPYHPGVSKLLEEVSASLSASGGKSESIWRMLTLRGIKALGGTIVESSRIESSVQKVLTTLQPLIIPTESATLKKDLVDIVSKSLTLWATAQNDSALITITSQPEPQDKAKWQADDLSTLDEEPSIPPDEKLDTASLKPLCLFPQILHTKATGEKATLHQGRALFPTSRVCIEGLLEKNRNEKELEQALLKTRFQYNARRISFSTGPGSPGGGRFAMLPG